MKLPKPFFRLPVRFDAERLRAEMEALPASAWSRHPQEYEGNTAARLISVGGGQTDVFVGEMAPTPALLASPYLQQVLATFSTVWSRSRLMRIAAGGKVPLHSDSIYHWFYRVRVHIPVITRPEVRFHCGDRDVHMAAGEAWVFDNWRQHRVENPSAEARVHLVADTAGTSEFWRLVMQGQADNFDRPDPRARLIAFDPAVRPRLMVERFNDWPLMPPSETEQLALDLLADLAPFDARPESAAAVGEFTNTVIAFCHDWRSLWYLHGDAAGTRGKFEDLAGSARRKLRQLRPVRVPSTDTIAQNVIDARMFSMLFGGAGGSRPEAVEFGAGNPRPDLPGPPPTDEPTLSSLPTVELPQVELPTVEVPKIEPHKPVVLDRPIVILSAPRAGSTLLFETLAQAAGVYTIGGESHQLIESIAALRPGRGVVRSNRLTRRDATSEIVAELRKRFGGRIHDRDGKPPPPGARVRLLEKTPKNALRVPFLLEVFPDAQFIFLQRERRANLSSMMQAWRAKGWITYRQLPGWPGPWSLLLPPGYERLQGRPLEEVVAFQWRVANETILDDLSDLPRERWTTVRYESLLANPQAEIGKLLGFAGLVMDSRLEGYLSKPLPLSKYTQTRPDPDKWKQNEAEIERVMPQLEDIARRLEVQNME
ncbi:MAG TPA: sulfotransferase [Steroidobacteraceae bacterium]|nr:sulfotransferase [Steroidobacteraceae bacterium]